MTDTWGEAIPILDGKRPEFVRDDDLISHTDVGSDSHWYGEKHGWTPAEISEWDWKKVTKIRLPTDHPYYRKPTMKIDDELVDQMVRLVRRLASKHDMCKITTDQAEAENIAALLPKPVDPEKEAVTALCQKHGFSVAAEAESDDSMWCEHGFTNSFGLDCFRAGRQFQRENG